MSKSILQMIVMLLVVGVILYFVSPFLPGAIVQLIIAVAAVGCLAWLLNIFGLWGGPPAG